MPTKYSEYSELSSTAPEEGGCAKWTAKLGIGATACCGVSLLSGILFWKFRNWDIGYAFHDDLNECRPAWALAAEQERRRLAEEDGTLMTLNDLPYKYGVVQNVFTGAIFPYNNFVQGFPEPGIWNAIKRFFRGGLGPKWKPPVQGEKMGVMSFNEFAQENMGKELPNSFFDDYYTGGKVPSWEDNERHETAVNILSNIVKASSAAGLRVIETTYPTEPRMAFDNEGLMKSAWDGFRYFGPLDIKYASNGFYGISVVEKLIERYNSTKEVLGLLMTDSVFSAHLQRDVGHDTFSIDLSSMDKYTPIKGYAPLGGSAKFRLDGGQLRTVRMEYGGKVYTEFDVPAVEEDYRRSRRSGWRMAEGAIIASLLSMTNLVMHVKDLHLELAAAFQAVTVDAFAGEPRHPVRRLLDPFISRSVQATNDNFKLLFEYHAADFSLAPLPHTEQLKLIGEAIRDKPLNLAEMDMENYGKVRNMDAEFSTSAAVANSSRWGWRWHYRALTVQRLYDELVRCWLDASGLDEGAITNDGVLQAWWKTMIDHLPSLKRAIAHNPEWTSDGKLTPTSLRHVARTLIVWLSWIHEDVGHSAAAYVYNPVYTPMCVPEDGVGVPLRSWNFNALAYRGFVFLHRAALLDEPPDFWFDGVEGCRDCFVNFQESLRRLGRDDIAFSECDKNGFYSCVDRVETAVSS